MKVLLNSAADAFDVFKLNNDKQLQGTNATAIQKSTFYVKLIDWL